jgi:hypothetical protein
VSERSREAAHRPSPAALQRHWHGSGQHQHAWTLNDGHGHGAELAGPATPVDDPDPFGYGPLVHERDKTFARPSSRYGRTPKKEDWTEV